MIIARLFKEYDDRWAAWMGGGKGHRRFARSGGPIERNGVQWAFFNFRYTFAAYFILDL